MNTTAKEATRLVIYDAMVTVIRPTRMAFGTIDTGAQPAPTGSRPLNIGQGRRIPLLGPHNQNFLLFFYFVDLAAKVPWVGLLPF